MAYRHRRRRRRSVANRPHRVYRATTRGRGGGKVYYGTTSRSLGRRASEHRRNSASPLHGKKFSIRTVARTRNRRQALAIERRRVRRSSRPVLNKRPSPRKRRNYW